MKHHNPQKDSPEAKTLELRGQTRFLTRSILLSETGSGWIIKWIIFFTLFLFLAFVLWASYMEIDEVSSAQGEIQPQGELVKIQHLIGGRIIHIAVSEGQLVKKGDLLIKLDPEISKLKIDEFTIKHKVLQAESVRLNALLDGKTPDFSSLKQIEAHIIRDQNRLFQENIRRDRSGESMIKNQIRQTQAQISELIREEKKLKKNVELQKEEMKLRKELLDKGLYSKLSYLSLQRNFNDSQTRLKQLPDQYNQLRARLNEMKGKLDEYVAKVRENYSKELALVNSNIMQTEKILAQFNSNLEYLELKSPVDGFIHWMRPKSALEIAEPGATLMEIVPSDKELLAQVKISARDIGHVSKGQFASVKLTTYNFRRYGDIDGSVKELSPSAFINEKGESYYKATIKLDKNNLGTDPSKNRVLPGMVLTADIKTGSKTLFEYLLKPIYYSSQSAFRER